MATVIISTTLAMSDYEPYRDFARENGLSDSAITRLVIKDFLDSPDPKRILKYIVKGKGRNEI